MAIERVNIPSTEWLMSERLRFVGASEAPITCGQSSYGSLAELYAEKQRLRPPLVDSAIFRRGRWGEAAGLQALAEEQPDWQVRRACVHVRDPERRLACTPDAFAMRPDRDGIGIVQHKVIGRSAYRRKFLDDPDGGLDSDATLPAAYRIQTLTEMLLNESTWGVLSVLIVGEFDWQLRLFEVERDEAIEARILHGVDTFWREYMDPGVMPPFEPQRDAELIKLLYPKDDGSEIDLSTDNRALAVTDEWIETSAARLRLEKAEKALKTELCGKIGEHTYGRLADGRRLSLKHQHRNGHTVGPSDFRVLRLNKESSHERT